MTYRKILNIIFICSVVTLFSSCRIGRSYKKPELPLPEKFDTMGLEEDVTAEMGWSTLYQDTVLQKLIEKALEDNKDMRIATAQIKELAAIKRINLAGLLPEFGVLVSGDREYLNYGGKDKSYENEFDAKLTFGWELDLWGNLRWQNEVGVTQFLQSVENQRALQLSIVAEVATMYFELKALDSELKIVKQTLEARQESFGFARLRYEGGMTSEIPYRQSMVELARTQTLVPKLENEIKLKENEIAVFLGEYPYDIPRGIDFKDIPDIEDLPVDLPSSVLMNRPDVREAELKLQEANAKVGVALTNMFPRIRLTGNLGGESDELRNFLQSPAWYIAGAITGPIFNFGKNNARHKAAKAAYEQEVYRYEKKVLNVFQEVSNAINTFQKTKEMYQSAAALYHSTKTYSELATLQYVNGVISYMDVLDAQRQLFDAEIALNDAVLNRMFATVSLYKALGGGLVK